MTAARRVVVTGLGIISPLGNDVATFWDRLERGMSGIGPIRAFDAREFPIKIAGEAIEMPLPSIPTAYRLSKLLKRSSRFAVAAAWTAAADAGLDPSSSGRRAAIYVATLPSEVDYDSTPILARRNEFQLRTLDPVFLFKHLPNNAACGLAAALDFRSPILGISSACAAGSVAMGEAFRAVRRGECDWAMAGGTCAPVTPLSMAGFALIRALTTRSDPRASCPFDAGRSGFVLGEGAAILVLESAEHARARGARVYGEVAGYGASMDGQHLITDPDPSGDGALEAMRAALESAACGSGDVQCIKAHGTSTRTNDRVETLAIRRLFGPRAARIPITAPKSMLGHSLTAAGAVEVVAALGILVRGVIPPTINHTTEDPECDLDYVPNVARRQHVDTILSNSFGMGGQNTSLVFRRTVP